MGQGKFTLQIPDKSRQFFIDLFGHTLYFKTDTSFLYIISGEDYKMKKGKQWIPFVLETCLLIILFLIGCTTKKVSPTLSGLATPELGQSPLMTVSAPQIPSISSAPGTGVVIGRLASSIKKNPEVLATGRVLLGGVIYDEEGRALYAYANPETSIEASFVDEYFYFANVPPGVYSLVYYTPNFLVPFVKEDKTSPTGISMVVLTVAADQQVDVGEVGLP